MEIRLDLAGSSPLMTHNDQAAVPGNPIKEAKDRLAAKATRRTDDEAEQLFYLEWLGGLHLNEDKQPCVPSLMVVRSISEAAARVRQGREVERSLLPLTPLLRINHGGPETLDELWAGGFWDRRMVRNSGRNAGRVPRCRPCFTTWQVTGAFDLDTSSLNVTDVVQHAQVAGRLYGIGDARRIGFGRFTVNVMAS